MNRKIIVCAVAVALAVGGLTTVAAQSANQPTNPNIFTAIQQIQVTLNGLVTGTLAGIQTNLTSLSTNVASIQTSLQASIRNAKDTPIIPLAATLAANQTASAVCTVTNLSTTQKTVTFEMLPLSTVQPTLLNGTLTVLPGSTTLSGTGILPASFGGFRCHYVVQDGTSNDITTSGTLTITASGQVVSITTVAGQ
jgi:hypothetical protein